MLFSKSNSMGEMGNQRKRDTMTAPHRATRTCRTKPRKFHGKCEGCGKSLCPEHAHCYTDDTNAAINNNSPYLCTKCYEEKHRVHIKTDVERYQDSLIRRLERMRDEMGVERLEIDRVIKFVRG